jgi:hypothetical protein
MKNIIKKVIKKLSNYQIIKLSNYQDELTFPVEATNLDIEAMLVAKKFSMTSYERLWATCSAVKYIKKNDIEGDFVECGVWRGGNSILMALIAKNLGINNKRFFLYDTFEGMTDPSFIDKDLSGVYAKDLLKSTKKVNGNNIWCIAGLDDVKNNFLKSSYPLELVNFIKGDVAETLRKEENLPDKISLLRLDTDWYESTKVELEVLFPLLVKGGVCIIDDYGHWQGAKKAVDEYFIRQNFFPLMNVTDYTGRVFIK